MNEAVFKAVIGRGAVSEVVVRHKEGKRFNVFVDGEVLVSQVGSPRIFRLQAAGEYLKYLGVSRFVVEV